MHPDLEVEAELEQLMATLAESDLESEAEWETRGSPPCSGPTRMVVSRFPRYGENIAALPPAEQQRVRQIASVILSSRHAGCSPILQIDLAGHADRDSQRGPAFEHRISARRALALQRALQQMIANPAISSRIVWQARGSGARNLVAKNPKNESERARNRRVEVVLSSRISAPYPVLVRAPGIGYTWTTRESARAVSGVREAESPLTFPDPVPISDSLRAPFKWICSLIVDFGPEPGPVVTGNRVIATGTGTLISSRHVLTAGHVLLSQGKLRKDIFGNPVNSTLAALSVTAIPGRDGGKVPVLEPLGRHSAIHFRVSPAWKDSYATNRAFDYGLITLDEPLPASYGFWPSGRGQILPPSDSGLKDKVAHCSGYPSSFCPPPDPALTVQCNDTNRGKVQFQMSGKVTSLSPELIETQMKIAGGHSGSPTWLLGPNDSINLVGIASASRIQAPEIAVRIRSALLDKIRAWMREDGVRPSF